MEIERKDDISPISLSQCIVCENYLGAGVCKAYRGYRANQPMIPVIILANEFDHTTGYPGDGGIIFSPLTPSDAALQQQAIRAANRSKVKRDAYYRREEQK